MLQSNILFEQKVNWDMNFVILIRMLAINLRFREVPENTTK